jgi:hypothetical protein
MIWTNLDALRNDAHYEVGQLSGEGQNVRIVTVTTIPYIEWGRLWEIGCP